MAKTHKDEIEFERDEWLSIITDTKESARKFFGAPAGWPVKFGGFAPHRKGRVFLVLATGLTVR
jgi:hypothetical protein